MTDIDLNALNIERNKKAIKQNRALMVISVILLSAVVMLSVANLSHDLSVCENNLYMHLVGEHNEND